MKWLSFPIAVIFLVVLQASFLPFFEIGGAVPNLILILSFFILIFRDFKEAIFWGGLGGFLFDFFSPGLFGQITLSLILTIIFIEILSKFLKKADFSPFLILAVLMIVFNQSFLAVSSFLINFFRIFEMSTVSPVMDPKILIAGFFYNLAIILLTYCLLNYGRSFFRRKRVRI